MRHHDWEVHHALLHKHGSAKFTRPTPRTERESPVLESFGNAHPREGLIIVVLCAIVLASAVIGLAKGWL